MNLIIKKVLNKLEDKGFEAYVVGGYVRDTLLGIKSTDVDICTSALPKDIIQIFNTSGNHINYGSIALSDGKYNFDITTYRKEHNYDDRSPGKVEYVDDLLTDLKRRDFTINTLCMDSSGNIIDLLNGKEDLEKKFIKVVGDTSLKLKEDPLRMLRAIRFSVILEFDLDPEIVKVINTDKHLIKSLSYTRRMEELNKIFASKNALVGLKILKELNLLEQLEINYDKIVPVNDVLGFWAQIKYSENYNFTKSSREVIKSIRKIVSSGEITNEVLFNYELYISMVAGQILGYDNKTISKMHADLKIKSVKDLSICSKDIFKILDIKPSSLVKDILKDITKNVLDGNLENNYEDIKNYILKKWK